MTSKSLIPELVIGIILLIIGVWTVPLLVPNVLAMTSEPYRATVDVNSMAYFNLLFSGLSCVLLGMIYFILGLYLIGLVVDALFTRNQKEKGVD
jgi:hypothetical protein